MWVMLVQQLINKYLNNIYNISDTLVYKLNLYSKIYNISLTLVCKSYSIEFEYCIT